MKSIDEMKNTRTFVDFDTHCVLKLQLTAYYVLKLQLYGNLLNICRNKNKLVRVIHINSNSIDQAQFENVCDLICVYVVYMCVLCVCVWFLFVTAMYGNV